MDDDTTPKWSRQDYLDMAACLRPSIMSISGYADALENIYRTPHHTAVSDFLQMMHKVLRCTPEDVLLYTNARYILVSKIVAWRLANGR